MCNNPCDRVREGWKHRTLLPPSSLWMSKVPVILRWYLFFLGECVWAMNYASIFLVDFFWANIYKLTKCYAGHFYYTWIVRQNDLAKVPSGTDLWHVLYELFMQTYYNWCSYVFILLIINIHIYITNIFLLVFNWNVTTVGWRLLRLYLPR